MKKGFTLIELSIVIVIIGLAFGGILGGRELINGAANRALIKQTSDIIHAVDLFKLQYQKLPGDMPAAQQYFSACTGVCQNGNGNGNIDEYPNREMDYVLSMLQWADIQIPTFDNVNGVDYIKSRFKDNAIIYFDADIQPNTLTNVVVAGYYSSMGLIAHEGPVVSPRDASNFDRKYDDGIGDSGLVRGLRAHGTGMDWDSCSTQYTTGGIAKGTGVLWDTSKKEVGCRMVLFQYK